MVLKRKSELVEEGVSHNPEIKKKTIIKNDLIPQLMTFREAVFLPGQSVEEHVHKTMYEVFYILEGKASFTIEGEEVILEQGDSIVVEEGETHSQSNPFEEPVKWVYFGIATD